MPYITASSVIEEGRIYRNGELLFEAGTPAGANAPLAPAAPILPAPGEFLSAAYRHFDLQYPKFYKMDLLSRLGWIATESLLGPGWDTTIYRPEDIAVVLSNANSSLDTDYKYNETTKDIPSPSVFVYTLPNIVTGEICIRHGFKGENAFFLSPSFDPVLLANYCGYLLEQGIANACITGWIDLLGDDYKAALFLIERTKRPDAPGFSSEAMRPDAPGISPETIRPDQPEFSPETMQAIFQNPSKPWM